MRSKQYKNTLSIIISICTFCSPSFAVEFAGNKIFPRLSEGSGMFISISGELLPPLFSSKPSIGDDEVIRFSKRRNEIFGTRDLIGTIVVGKKLFSGCDESLFYTNKDDFVHNRTKFY